MKTPLLRDWRFWVYFAIFVFAASCYFWPQPVWLQVVAVVLGVGTFLSELVTEEKCT